MKRVKDVSHLDYLRRRPFLVVIMFLKPPTGWPTERKGWKEHSIVSERPSVVHRISTDHLRTAAVIIDVLNDRVVKNRFTDEMSDEEALRHFKAKHAGVIAQHVI